MFRYHLILFSCNKTLHTYLHKNLIRIPLPPSVSTEIFNNKVTLSVLSEFASVPIGVVLKHRILVLHTRNEGEESNITHNEVENKLN